MGEPFLVVETAYWPLVHNVPDQPGFLVCFLAGDFGRFPSLHRPSLGDHPTMGLARGQQHDLANTAVADTPRQDPKLPSAIQLRFCHLTFVSALNL